MTELDKYIVNRTSHTRKYENAKISSKTSLEEFILDPGAWVRLLTVAFFAPTTLFRAVKYGGGIGLPSALFILLNTFYCTALLHSGGYVLGKSILGGLYVSGLSLVLWYICSMFLHSLRKRMAVHPRFPHFLRFAVWNQLIWFWPTVLAYSASFLWPTGDLILAVTVCLSFGYSVFGFVSVFKPRSILAPLSTLICALSLFATLSVVVGLRGVDGQHSEASAWMDPKVAIPRLEYHYLNEKRVMIARYEKWRNPNYQAPEKPKLAAK